MKRLLIGAFAVALGFGVTTARAAEGIALPEQTWSFDGIFGSFDRAALQRGFQIYKESCASCHSLKYIAYRNLSDLGYNEEEVKALAAEATVVDGPDDEGEMFERPGRPSDYFPSPFANAKAAAASNGGAVPPDLSLMAKARKGGPDFIYALLTGFEDLPGNFKDLPEYSYLPKDFEPSEDLNFNKYFPGHQIAMAAPLFDDGVEYADGTPATVDQMARDVSHFLMWSAEPKLEVRKQTGFKVILFLIVLTILLYAAKRKVWSDLH